MKVSVRPRKVRVRVRPRLRQESHYGLKLDFSNIAIP